MASGLIAMMIDKLERNVRPAAADRKLLIAFLIDYEALLKKTKSSSLDRPRPIVKLKPKYKVKT